MSPLVQVIVASGIFLLVLGLAVTDLYMKRKNFNTLDLTEEERDKIKCLARGAYLDKIFDLATFLLLVLVVQVVIGRFAGGTCPLRSSYARFLLFGAMSLIPFGLGYVWNLLPEGRKLEREAELSRIGRAESTTSSRIQRLLWRPWIGIFHLFFYLWAAGCIYLSLG